MQMQTLFWGLMIAWLIFGLWVYWPSTPTGVGSYGPLGGSLLLFVLLGLLGWKCFGKPIQG